MAEIKYEIVKNIGVHPSRPLGTLRVHTRRRRKGAPNAPKDICRLAPSCGARRHERWG